MKTSSLSERTDIDLNKEHITESFKTIQDQICNGLEELDGKSTFVEDPWERSGGGGGRTRIMSEGDVIEKGGVNFSAVFGEVPAPIKKMFEVESAKFYATGVSIVLHPKNPHVPIIHANIRYFEMDGGHCWFGGGIDLTPHYVTPEMAGKFHNGLKEVCDKHHESYYSEFKKWADDYFFIEHRNETRGVGGIFFDRLSSDEDFSLEDRFNFVKDVGGAFVPLYSEQVNKFRNIDWNDQEREWQLLRRGRYVEFNLVYDKGTRFGLQTGGRIESILMSLPKDASWYYNHQPEEGSREAETLSLLKKDVDWTSL